MISSKQKMAEWILDFFRKNNCRANEIVLFPVVMNSLFGLNPKEKDLFNSVANELINNGYMIFEQEPVQCIRLTGKGEEYIYNPNGVLDCCIDVRKPNEKIFREIIFVGQIVCALQSYEDIINRCDANEVVKPLADQAQHFERMRQMVIETPQEYYIFLYSFFYSTCRLLCQLDDVDLRDVLLKYIHTVSGIIKKESKIKQENIHPEYLEVYSKAVECAKSEIERDDIILMKSLLFV